MRPFDIGSARCDRDRPRRPVANLPAVDANHRHHKAGRGRDECFSRLFRFSDGKRAFFDFAGYQRQDSSTGNAVEDIAIERMCYQHTLPRYDMRVLRRTFGDNSVTFHPGIIRALRNRLVLHERSVEQLRGFDICPAPAQIRDRDDTDTALREWVVD